VSFLLTLVRNVDDIVDFWPNQQQVALLSIVSMRGLQCPRLLLELLAAVVSQIGQRASRRAVHVERNVYDAVQITPTTITPAQSRP